MSATEALCRLEDISDGGAKGLWSDSRGRDLVLAVRKGQQVFAYLNLCPHYGRSRLGWKKDEFLNGNRTKIVCSAHGALFNIEDGACVVGPCLGQALAPLDVEVVGGEVHARLEDLPPREAGQRLSA